MPFLLALTATVNRASNVVVFPFFFPVYSGRYEESMRAALEVKRNLPDSLLENPIMNRFFESFLSIEVHVLIRFGKWTEILGKEIPTDHKVS